MKNSISGKSYPLLLSISLLSGISALIYQITWIRQFTLFFGIQLLSVSTVLAAFMAGLAIGNWIFGRFSDLKINPILLLIIMQSGIAVFALLFQPGIKTVEELYSYLIRNLHITGDQMALIKFLLSFLFLLIPTILMGGVIPVLSKFMVRNLVRIGNRISWIYALNNLGAAAGCLLAGFFLIRLAGIQITIYTACCANLISAAFAGLLLISGIQILHENNHGNSHEKDQVITSYTESERQKIYPRRIVRLVLWIFAIEGFTTLAYEVLWSRLIVEYVSEKNTYYYTVIVFSFIAGLSAGSYLIRKKADLIRDKVRFIGIIETIIGFSSLLFFIIFVTISPSLKVQPEIGLSWLEIAGRQYLLIFLLLIIPPSLMGMTFPLVSKIYTDHLEYVGSRIGFLGFLDTAGSILGSFMTGFFLIRFMGIYYSFLVVVLLNLFPGLLLASYKEQNDKLRIGISVISTAIFFLVILLCFPHEKYIHLRFKYYPGEKILAYQEGASATVSVNQVTSGHLALVVNGSKTAYSSTEDLKVHTLLAYLPFVFTEKPEKAMVIGFGMGVTTNCLSRISGLRTDVAEISREVMNLSEVYFGFLNNHCARADNVNILIDDGRSYLFRSEGNYDIITTNSVHPRLSPNLYTLDFYELCAGKMSEDGIICQWMPTNWITKEEFASLVKAFIEIFPFNSLWYLSRSHLLLIGSKKSLDYDFMNLTSKFSDPLISQFLIDCEIYNSAQLAGMLAATENELNNMFKETLPDRDNFPVAEYSREVNLAPNLEVLGQIIQIPFTPGKIWRNFGEVGYINQINHYHIEYMSTLDRFIKEMKYTNEVPERK
jgi:spermidine synthase